MDFNVVINSDTISLSPFVPGTSAKAIISFDKSLLEVLACPLSGNELVFDEKRNVLVSEAIGMAFPINSAGIPLLLSKWTIPLEDLDKCK